MGVAQPDDLALCGWQRDYRRADRVTQFTGEQLVFGELVFGRRHKPVPGPAVIVWTTKPVWT
jgi:hypothetical protein